MPSEQSSTPERQLLKLIEEKKKSSSLASKGSMRKGLSFFSLGAIRGRLSFLEEKLKRILSGGLSLDLSSINKLLIVVVLGTLFILIFNFIDSMLGLEKQVEASFKIEGKEPAFKFQDVSILKKPAYYLEQARKRDIFNLASKTVPKQTPKELGIQEVKEVTEEKDNLRLVGISWSDDPDAMIEDLRSKRTFFVKRGSTIINGIEVVAIFRDKVVLRYKGKELELK